MKEVVIQELMKINMPFEWTAPLSFEFALSDSAKVDDVSRQTGFLSGQASRQSSGVSFFSSVNSGAALPCLEFRTQNIISPLFAGEGVLRPCPALKTDSREFHCNR